MINKLYRFEVKCDKCKTSDIIEAPDEKEVLKRLPLDDWHKTETQLLCRTCAGYGDF